MNKVFFKSAVHLPEVFAPFQWVPPLGESELCLAGSWRAPWSVQGLHLPHPPLLWTFHRCLLLGFFLLGLTRCPLSLAGLYAQYGIQCHIVAAGVGGSSRFSVGLLCLLVGLLQFLLLCPPLLLFPVISQLLHPFCNVWIIFIPAAIPQLGLHCVLSP